MYILEFTILVQWVFDYRMVIILVRLIFGSVFTRKVVNYLMSSEYLRVRVDSVTLGDADISKCLSSFSGNHNRLCGCHIVPREWSSLHNKVQ